MRILSCFWNICRRHDPVPGDRTNIFRKVEFFSQTSTGHLSLDKRLSVHESDGLTRKATGIMYMRSHIRRLDLTLLMGTGNVNRVYEHGLVVGRGYNLWSLHSCIDTHPCVIALYLVCTRPPNSSVCANKTSRHTHPSRHQVDDRSRPASAFVIPTRSGNQFGILSWSEEQQILEEMTSNAGAATNADDR